MWVDMICSSSVGCLCFNEPVPQSEVVEKSVVKCCLTETREEATRAQKAVSFVFPDTQPGTETHSPAHRHTVRHRDTQHGTAQTHNPAAAKRNAVHWNQNDRLRYIWPLWNNFCLFVSIWQNISVVTIHTIYRWQMDTLSEKSTKNSIFRLFTQETY